MIYSVNVKPDEVMFLTTAPSVEVFQPSNIDNFSVGKQLQKSVFIIVHFKYF